ncbi:MAG: tetrahydromethanopterin S-methyltransferase subunit H [Candidatus Bathyarchaeota archaeon]|nr:tetrahydromethanopterin S-methyltransferase subunit H [Candidatus Bathyarchaeota archaeon]
MFKLKAKQKIFEIGGVKVGGQPGEVPTVLIGSIFYLGHTKIDIDEEKGTFDKEKAEALIKKQEELSDMTGNPGMLEVVGVRPDALRREIDYIAEVTDMPFLISSERPPVLMAGAKHVGEIGLQDRVVYSSLLKGTSDEELEIVKNSGIKAALLLAKNPMEETADGKLKVVKDVLKLAGKAKIEKPLIDVATLAFGIKMGPAARALYLIKNEYGYPVGIGTGNVTTTFNWAINRLTRPILRTTYGTCNAIAQVMGANWLLYGPIQHAPYVFPSVAMTDSYILTAMAELGIRPAVEKQHPLFNVLRG